MAGEVRRCQCCQVVSDQHLTELAGHVVRWEGVALPLGLTEADVVVIQKNDCGDYALQKIQCLLKWKKLNGDKATYENLLKAVKSGGENLDSACSRLLGKPNLMWAKSVFTEVNVIFKWIHSII